MIHLLRRFLSFLLFAGFTLLAHAQLDKQMPGESDAQFEQRKAIMAKVRAEQAAMAKLPNRDFDMGHAVPRAYPRPPSAWQSAEKGFYAEVLAAGKFEVLVVPFQVQDRAFARDLRSLMTAQLVSAMAAAGAKSIPDPYLVGRALGDGQRGYDLMEVFRLANKLGAKRIVAAYAGHDMKKPNTMRVTLHYYDLGDQAHFWETFLPTDNGHGVLKGSERLNSRHFEGLRFDDEQTPIDALQGILPEMVKFLGMTPAQPALAVSRLANPALPATPLGLVSAKPEPARDAYYFQLLAALTPQGADRARERLNEKSMLAVLQMSPQSPDYRALKARALMNMGLRPAAMGVLGQASSAEEKHLAALLDGNLPEVQASRARIPPGVRAFIATLEENAIAAAYGGHTPESSLARLDGLKLPGDAWKFLAARALTDWNDWTQHPNMLLKALLDREFPIEGFSAQGMMSGATALSAPQNLEVRLHLSVFDHVRRQMRGGAAKWCCQPLGAQPRPLDYLDLLEGMGTDNLVRQMKLHVRQQGAPESALRFIGTIDSVYRDHPYLAALRGEAELDIAEKVGGEQAEALRRSAYASGFNAWYWEQGQTRAAAYAHDYVITQARRADFGGYDNLYGHDYPFRSYYPPQMLPHVQNTVLSNLRLALRNTTFDFTPMEELAEKLTQWKRLDELDELLKSVEGRFAGNAKRTQMLAKSSLRKGDTRAAEKYYREGMRAQPMDSQSYTELGSLLFRDGASEQAASVFKSYPGIGKPSEVNAVELSNYAYVAGSLFYWSGQFNLAVPLYEVAAGLRTGSEASMTAEMRLRLLKRDYTSALQTSFERGQRYRSAFAFRDSIGLLHAMGRSKEAWDAFNMIAAQMDDPQPWETALVGQHIGGVSEKQITDWASMWRKAGRRYPYAPMHLLRAGVTDRMPSAGLAASIATVDRPVWKLQDMFGAVVAATEEPNVHVVLGPRAVEDATLARGMFDKTEKVRVRSHFVQFAEAYRQIRDGQFEAARAGLEQAASLYDVRNESLGYLLPYYAYAAARARNVGGVQAVLDSFPPQERAFDYQLSKAVIAALQAKPDEAMQHLKLALHRRPFTGRRPVFPEYQYAELCEWLFEATKEPRYRDAALSWARQNQAFQPWFAWAYAMEAKLATTPQERARAIAMTHYLDRNSERLSKLPPAEVEAALREYGQRNPFRTKATGADLGAPPRG